MARIYRLGPKDQDLFAEMLNLFGREFDEPDTYGSNRPGTKYVSELLESTTFVALVAIEDDLVVGALVAYELPKFEQARSEFYIYDLAVDKNYRRRGVATDLINETRRIAKDRDGWVVMIQADYGDEPAISLYSKLGKREEILHFDIDVKV